MSERWEYILHLRVGDTSAITEITGTFIGTFMQAFQHINMLSRDYQGTIVNHEIYKKGEKRNAVKRLTQEKQQVLALPPPPPQVVTKVEPPTLPEGCVIVKEISYTVKEYTHHAKESSDGNGNRGKTNGSHPPCVLH